MRFVALLRGRSRFVLTALLLAASIGPGKASRRPGFSPLFTGSLGEATIENGGTFTIENGVLRAEDRTAGCSFPSSCAISDCASSCVSLPAMATVASFYERCRTASSIAVGRTAAIRCNS